MAEAIGSILGNAVGVAVSPGPVIAVILVLLSRSAKTNGAAFLIGWLLGLIGLSLLVLAIGPTGDDGEPSTLGLVIKLVIGGLFLFLALHQWRARPEPDAEPTMPRWMSAIEGFSPVRALGFGVLFASVSPKNLGLVVAAAVSISSSGLAAAGQGVTVLVFVTLSSVSIIAPIVLKLVGGEGTERSLTRMKTWLVANNNTLMALVFLILGAKILGEGLAIFGEEPRGPGLIHHG